MPEAIQQSVDFNAPPETLYEMYLDSRGAFPGNRGSFGKMGRRVGITFSAFGGAFVRART